MDIELALKLTEIVEKIGDNKTTLCSKINECKTNIALVGQKLDIHLKNQKEKEDKKDRVFDKKTVIIGIIIGVIGLVAALK